jgi:hypothetical protein
VTTPPTSEPTKKCTSCGQTKLLSEFHKDKFHSGGVMHVCTKCRSKQRKAVREARKTLGPPPEICTICDEVPPVWHLDHDHETGTPRGWLCSRCNMGLGKFDDDPTRLRRAAA